MKITKKGKPPAERVWVGTCRKCNSEAEAMESELTHISHNERGEAFSWEICPVCEAGDKTTEYDGMLFYPKHEI